MVEKPSNSQKQDTNKKHNTEQVWDSLLYLDRF